MAIHQGLDNYLSYKSLVKDTKTRWIIELHHFILTTEYRANFLDIFVGVAR